MPERDDCSHLFRLLFEVKASDPLAFAVVAGILPLVALLATPIPAYRAFTWSRSRRVCYQQAPRGGSPTQTL
jgi:hypothetical protein